MESLSWDHKELPFSATQIKAAVEAHPTPFHLYNERAIRGNANDCHSQFRRYFPSFKNYYAVKSCPNPYIMKLLKQEGMGVVCSSMTELILAEKVGFKGEEIMFTSNNTPAAEYIRAHELGAIINIDDITHIDFIKAHIGKLPDFMCLRYNPGSLKTGISLVGVPTEAKFGLTREQVKQAYTRMKELGVTRFGLHSMVISEELRIEYLGDTAKMLFELVLEIHSEFGISTELVNLGGGIGIPCNATQTSVNYADLSSIINTHYQEYIVKNGLPFQIVTECGQMMVGPYGVLVTRVVEQKVTYKNHLGIDACLANEMRAFLRGIYKSISVFGKDWKLKVSNSYPTSSETVGCDLHVYDVNGSTCMYEKLAVDRVLPIVEIGDILVIHDTGAYGHALGINYNGKLQGAEYLVIDNDIKQIRRAQTYVDLFATLSFPRPK